MGAIECEVKVLQKGKPLLFTWENPLRGSVECVLVTCSCQQLKLESKESRPWVEDKNWVPSLVRALEKSEVCSFNATEPCSSLAKHFPDLPSCEGEDLKELSKKKKKRKSRKRAAKLAKNRKSQSLTPEADDQEDKIDSQTGVRDGIASTLAGQDNGTLEGDETAAAAGISDDDKSFEDDSDLSDSDANDSDGAQVDSQESFLGKSEPLGDDCDDEDPNRVKASTDGDSRNQEGVEDIMETVDHSFTGKTTEQLVGGLNAAAVDDHGGTSAEGHDPDLVSLESIQVLPADLQPQPGSSMLPVDNALMKAIDSIMVMQMTRTSEENLVSQLISEQGLDDPPPDFVTMPADPDAPATNVEFIRPLTEAERQKMFTFRKDQEERNRQVLQGLRESAKGVYLCEYCGKILTKSTRKKHLATHVERERQFLCDECGKGFYTKEGLRNHIKTHNPDPRFQCRYCPKKYKSFYGRTIHERLHFGVYSSSCEKCGRKFSDNKVMRSHIQICLGPSGPGRRKLSRPRRRGPPRSAGDPGTTVCHICSKVLATGSFRAHMDIHEGKMFTCPICSKIMKYNTRASHMTRHRDTRDFSCQYCGKLFKTKQGMRVHTRVHTGEKPHKCRYCDRYFSRYSSREVHEGTHTNLRPYRCQICDKAWKDRSSYWLHMKKNHPGEPLYYKRLTAEINSKEGRNFFVDPIKLAPEDPAPQLQSL